MPTPMTEPSTKTLRPRKPKDLAPGAPDLPRLRRTSAEVRAEKERKEAEKESSVAKTKAAKARVNELRKALHQERVDSNPPGTKTGSKKVGTRSGKTSVLKKGVTSRLKANLKANRVPPLLAKVTEPSVDETALGSGDESTSPDEAEPGDEAMTVDEHEPQDPPTLGDNFQPPADFRDRKGRLMAVLRRHQQPLGKPKTGSTASNNPKLSLPKATASTVVNKPRGFAKEWFNNDGPTATLPLGSQELRRTPSVEDHVIEKSSGAGTGHPQPISAMVHVKSHAKPVAKAKKERASRSLLSDIPATLMSRYLSDFQPSFIHTSITISSDPWDKLSVDDAQELFAAVFPEVAHEIMFGDTFYAPANQTASMIRNHVKEAGLAAVHCAMRDLAPTARKHLAHKAECHGKEFPFIYRCYTVTEIPDRHTEGGDAVRREGPFLSPIICETLAAYYNQLGEAIPEPAFGSDTDLELHAPIGAYALCTAAVRRALRTYSTGEYIATRQRFDQVNSGQTTAKMVKLLKKQDHETWNLVLTQVARAAVDLKKRTRKARGVPRASGENGDDSGSDIEVYGS